MCWEKSLGEAVSGKKTLVLCVGNDMKGDDAVGKYVYERLKTESKLYCAEMPENYLGRIEELGPDALLIVDAADFGGEPGQVAFAELRDFSAPSLSTHALSMSIMSRFLKGIEVFLVGVQPKTLEFGKKMGKEARAGADEIAAILNKHLA